MSGTLTISIVGVGAKEADGTTSLSGHIWYTVTDSAGTTTSFGFVPASSGSPFGAGKVVTTDNSNYMNGSVLSQSATLTDAQVQAALNYGNGLQALADYNGGKSDTPPTGLDSTLMSFNTTYNFTGGYNLTGGPYGDQGSFGNNCESFVNGMLSYVGQQTGTSISSIEALSLPEWQAGAASAILGGLNSQNGGSLATTTVSEAGVTTTVIGQNSAPDANGNRTLLSDTWTSSDGSSGADVYYSASNLKSTITNSDGSGSVITSKSLTHKCRFA